METGVIFKKETKDAIDTYYSGEERVYEGESANRFESLQSSFGLLHSLLEKHKDILKDIYEWYATAIVRRGREPLEKERFLYHFQEGSFDTSYVFGSPEQGYALGYQKYGVFVPTHFAPKTMRGGYELIKELRESTEMPVVMAITEDLKKTIEKMPCWHDLNLGFLSQFRSDLAKKNIVYNDHLDTQKLMHGLVAEYLNQQESFISNESEFDED